MRIPPGFRPYLHFDVSASDPYVKQAIYIFIWLKNIFYPLKIIFKTKINKMFTHASDFR